MKAYFQILLTALLISGIIYACSSDSEEPAPEPDTTAPSLDFTIAGISNNLGSSPVLSGQIVVNVNAQDSGGIAKVEAFIDNQKVGEDTTAPFQITIDISSYTSKIAQTAKFKDYNLKIVVTDTSGNTTSKEQIINIDNELPVISEVSLETNTIINGDLNAITFTVSDNEELLSVKTLINDNLLQEHENQVYETNINTNGLSDGENTLKIEAVDMAQNKAVFEVSFIVDNSGPEIILNTISDDQIIDEKFIFKPEIADEYSSTTSFVAKLNGNIIIESSSDEVEGIEIDPEIFEVGDVVFELTAKDDLENITNLVINTRIQRRLFTVQMDEGFLENSWLSFWILVSELDGSPITFISAELGDSEIKVHAPSEFSKEKEYMVSFIADENRSGWVQTHMTVIQNLTRVNFEHIHFTPPFGSNYSDTYTDMNGFNTTDQIRGQGRNFQLYSNDQNQTLKLTRNEGYGQYFPENAYLTGTDLFPDTPYSYLKIENPWNSNSQIVKESFTTENVQTGFADFSVNNLPYINPRLSIFGFESEQDFQNDSYHYLFVYENQPVQFGGGVQYHFPDIFYKYRHHVRINRYNTIREGKPLAQYIIPDWIPQYSQAGHEIVVNNTGNGYIVGRLTLTYGKQDGGYQSFVMVYDSSKNSNVYVPQLPEEMSNLSIYEAFQSQSFEVQYSDLSSFENMTSYEEYLNQVISPYKEHYKASSVIEVMLDEGSNLGAILSNWTFKYH